MSDVLDVRINGVFVDHATETAVVLLGELTEPGRVLPIAIGTAEAQAIAIGISTIDAPRPVAHDLVLRVIAAARGSLRRVDVVALVRETFIAELEVVMHDRVVRLDARPSDCIALAVRADVPIGVDRDLFDRASIDTREHPSGSQDDERIDEIMREFREFLESTEPRDFRRSDRDGAGEDDSSP